MPIDLDGESARDPMVVAETFALSGRNQYACDRNAPYWLAIPGATRLLAMRQGVAERLAAIDAQLEPAGLRLFLFDAWRPIAVQAYFHDVWMPERLSRLRPDLHGDALIEEVERYWSAPSKDARSPAPHATGAAIDLTLVDVEAGVPPLYERRVR